MTNKKEISLVACINKKGYIGKGGELLYSIKEDMEEFKSVTKGKAVVMGYKTYEEIGKGLPNRRNYVIGREGSKVDKSIYGLYTSLEGCIRALEGEECIVIIGGEKLYNEALRLLIVDRVILGVVGGYEEGDRGIKMELLREGYDEVSEQDKGIVKDRKSGRSYEYKVKEYKRKGRGNNGD